MRTIELKPTERAIVGRAGDTGVTVKFHALAWHTAYPAGLPYLMVTAPAGVRWPVTVEYADGWITGAVPDELLVRPGTYTYAFGWVSAGSQVRSSPCGAIVLAGDTKPWNPHDKGPDWADRIFLAAEAIENASDGASEAADAAQAAQAAAEEAQGEAETAQTGAETAQTAAAASEANIQAMLRNMESVITNAETAMNGIISQKNQMIESIAAIAEMGTDKTLSQDGVAADAAATGEVKAALDSKLVPDDPANKPELIRGAYINDSGVDTVNTKFYGTDLIEPDANLAVEIIGDTWEYAVVLYDSNGNKEDGSGYIGKTSIRTSMYYVPNTVGKIAFLMHRKDNTVIPSGSGAAAKAMKADALAALQIYRITDTTLTKPGVPADAMEVGDILRTVQEDVGDLKDDKVNKPAQAPDGTAGQFLRTLGDGTTEWATPGLPTGDMITAATNAWLDAHPEASTSVQDHSIEYNKMSEDVMYYVTPDSFGAAGDGVTDDTAAVVSALATGKPVRGVGTYLVTELTLNGADIDLNLNVTGTITLEDNNRVAGRLNNVQWSSLGRDGCVIKVTGENNVIRDTLFTGSISTGSAVVVMLSASNLIVDRCTFDPYCKIDVNINGCNVRVTNCTFKAHTDETVSTLNVYSNGIKISYYLDHDLPNGADIIVDNCFFGEHGDNAIDCYSGAQRVLISNNLMITPTHRCIEIKTKVPATPVAGLSDTYIIRGNVLIGKGCIDCHAQFPEEDIALKKLVITGCMCFSTGLTGAILFNAESSQIHGCYIEAGGKNALSTKNDLELSNCVIRDAVCLLTNTDNGNSICLTGCNIEATTIGIVPAGAQWHVSNCNIHTTDQVFRNIYGKLFMMNCKIVSDAETIATIPARDLTAETPVDPAVCLIGNVLGTTNEETTALIETDENDRPHKLITIANLHTQQLTDYEYTETIPFPDS